MVKELTLDVVARKNSKDLTLLAQEFDRLAKEVDDSGKSMQKFTSFSKFLEDQTVKTKTEISRLKTEFDKTGNLDLASKIAGLERNSKALENLGKRFATTVEDGISTGVQDGSQQGIKFLGNAFGSLPPEAQAGIAAGVAGAVLVGAPAIGAALNGALLAGVGAAGIGVAIATQLKNPAVSSALSTLKTELSADLTQATSSFAPVLIDGAAKFGAAFARVEPVLEKGFEAIAGPADRLFTGIGKFTENAAPGLTKALQGAGIVIDELAADVPALGRDFGEMFALLGDGGPGGADAIGKITHAVGILAVATGAEFDLLSKVFTGLEIAADLSAGKFTEAATKMAELNGGFHQGADEAGKLNTQIGLLGSGASGAAGGLSALATATGNFNTAAANAKLNSLQFNDGIAALQEQLKQNKGAFDDNTTAGRAAEEQYLNLATQAQQTAQTVYTNTGNAVEAATAYKNLKDKLDAAAIQAGVSRTELDKLNTSLDNTFKVRTITDKVDIEVNVTGSGKGLFTNQGTTLLGGTGIKFLAGGGDFQAGQPMIVGEHGPEFMIPSASGSIVPNDKLRSLGTVPSFRAPARAAASQPQRVILDVGAGADGLFATALMQAIRIGMVQLRTASGEPVMT